MDQENSHGLPQKMSTMANGPKEKKNGFGTMVYGDKSVYTGGWTDDKRNGEGKMTVITKEGTYSYEGEWVMD